MAGPLLQLRDVRRAFPGAPGRGDLEVLRGVDLELDEGHSLAILGPSGSGKSTLLQLIGGLDTPTSGSVQLGGEDLSALDEAGLARVRGQDVGFVFQFHHLLPQCSALENVLVPSLVHPAEVREAAPERARQLLHRVGLGERMDHRPAALSGGECQRVAVVRALVHRPRLVVADEPTGSLDPRSAVALGDLLLEACSEQGAALVTVTHSRELAARMGRTLYLEDGRLVADEAPVT